MNKNAYQNVFYICKKSLFIFCSLFYYSNILACFWGFRDFCKGLSTKYNDLDVNHINGGSKWTPLHAAAFMENGPIVMYLLDKGAEIDAGDKYGR